MSDESNGGDEINEIQATIGEVQLQVSGSDEQWVESAFDKKLHKLLLEYEDMDDQYEIGAGAGHLMAYGYADSPEEAKEKWEEMRDRMINDVKDLSEEERRQMGLNDSL